MENITTNKRTFIVIAGMTPQDVINSSDATQQQKKFAHVFDSDGVIGYSQREADVFNATLINEKGHNGVSLWTRYADGSKKETKYVGDITNFKYAPSGDLKPYNMAQTYNSDEYFENPKNTVIKYEKVNNGFFEYKKGKYIIREEYFSDGKIKTQLIKHVSFDKSKSYGYVDIIRYNEKGVVRKHKTIRTFDLSDTPNI